MRWMVIVLLVSLAGLLAAAMGVARHIWLQRSQMRMDAVRPAETGAGIAEKAESEVEI